MAERFISECQIAPGIGNCHTMVLVVPREGLTEVLQRLGRGQDEPYIVSVSK